MTVAMAYEGMIARRLRISPVSPISGRPNGLEQMLARATRIDPAAGDYHEQAAYVWAPDDELFSECIKRIVDEQAAEIALRAEHVNSVRPAPSGPIVPINAQATETRAEDMQTGQVIGAAEVARIKAALAEVGLKGVNPFQFKRAIDALEKHAPVETAAEIMPDMTVSELGTETTSGDRSTDQKSLCRRCRENQNMERTGNPGAGMPSR